MGCERTVYKHWLALNECVCTTHIDSLRHKVRLVKDSTLGAKNSHWSGIVFGKWSHLILGDPIDPPKIIESVICASGRL